MGVVNELFFLPESPLLGFGPSNDERPDGTWPARVVFSQFYDVAVFCAAKVWQQRTHFPLRTVGSGFEVSTKGYRDEPPGVIVEGTVIVAFVEAMQTQGKTEPEYPAFQIGLTAFVNQIMGESDTGLTDLHNLIECSHWAGATLSQR